MGEFRLTKLAKDDLTRIAKYTEIQWGKEQRNFYLKQFDDIFHLIADKPHVGKECDYIKIDFRKFPQGSHIIFYKEVSKSSTEIIRILHKSMDILSKFD
ncbi:MAG: type II toxin-antitoxin system RelE/ParE family toxin [Gammaproteobacteria bacterium]|nr:type II toxin-antitoxin system RelE/ParE family toxin [Gammaproteobacteria bacterium]